MGAGGRTGVGRGVGLVVGAGGVVVGVPTGTGGIELGLIVGVIVVGVVAVCELFWVFSVVGGVVGEVGVVGVDDPPLTFVPDLLVVDYVDGDG